MFSKGKKSGFIFLSPNPTQAQTFAQYLILSQFVILLPFLIKEGKILMNCQCYSNSFL